MCHSRWSVVGVLGIYNLDNTIEFIAAHADWLTPQEKQDKWHELFDSE